VSIQEIIGERTMDSELNFGHGYNETNSIAIIWCIDDVRQTIKNYEIAVELTDDECMEVLDYCLDKHDAEYGVGWENIYQAIVYCFEDKLKGKNDE
tara:strand:+ start:92 stop:379 length:288 start_codon:yes stop_codon:yes gene_type:complete